MNILDEIIEYKKDFVQKVKSKVSIDQLKDSPKFNSEKISLTSSLCKQKGGIISEFKRKSPSVSDINLGANINQRVESYLAGKTNGISVLTDEMYFHGKLSDLAQVSKISDVPILRKDFIIDCYQIYEAKATGAHAVLLIAYCLPKDQIAEFTSLSHELGLEVLFEIHDYKELSKFDSQVDILGINNRNLTNFKVDYNYAIEIAQDLPDNCVKISESGIHSINSYQQTIDAGYDGCLIGEFLMKHNNPTKTIQLLHESVN